MRHRDRDARGKRAHKTRPRGRFQLLEICSPRLTLASFASNPPTAPRALSPHCGAHPGHEPAREPARRAARLPLKAAAAAAAAARRPAARPVAPMDRKRAASDADGPDTLPPPKHFRPADDVPAPALPPAPAGAPAPAAPSPRPSAPPAPDDPPSAPAAPAPPSEPPVPGDPPDPDPIIHYQRAQLAAKIAEQARDLFWLRDKVNELQKLVAVLDAAPRAALYHMHAVREDLTLTMARLGLSHHLDPADCPLAATMLDAEVVTNESLAEIPAALKRLTAQLVLALEAKEAQPPPDPERKTANADLHRRVREVSDQLERYAERDKQSLVSSTTFRDEYDDLRLEASGQRRRIVALELQLREKSENLSAARFVKQEDPKPGDDSKLAVKTENVGKDAAESASNQTSTIANGDLQLAEAAARELSEKRLEELAEAHDQNKRLISEVERLKADIARRENNVVPVKTILDSALYQTMEATLQQLYLKERTWQMERDAQNEEREAERKDAEERMEEAKTTSDKGMEDLRRQMEELRRIADAAKIEKDKVVMTYEARKMEAGNAAAVITAAERRAKVSEEMRKKLTKSNSELTKEVEKLRARVHETEQVRKDRGTVSPNHYLCCDWGLIISG